MFDEPGLRAAPHPPWGPIPSCPQLAHPTPGLHRTRGRPTFPHLHQHALEVTIIRFMTMILHMVARNGLASVAKSAAPAGVWDHEDDIGSIHN